MSGLSQLLQTGLSGLSAASEALQTVANNTANVNTPGYNVQSVNQTELPGTAGGPGAGTDVTSIQRAFSQFLFQQGVQASSANQAAQVIESNAQNLAAIFPVASGGAGGLGSALDSFFSAANQVAQDPTSAANRQVFLGQAQSLAAAFRSVSGQISASLGSIETQTTAAVQQINTLTQQIAAIEPSNPGADHRCRRAAEQPARSTRRTGAAACSANRRQFGARREWGGECLYGRWCCSGQWRDRLSARDRPKPIWRRPAHGHLWSNRTGFDREPIGRAARRIARGARPAGQHPGFGGSACGWPRCRREHPTIAGARSQRQSGAAAVFGRRAGRLCCAIQYRQRQPDRDDHRPRQFYPRRFYRRPAPQPGSRRPTRRPAR